MKSGKNPIARALRRLRPKVKPSAKLYKRKGRKEITPTGLLFVLTLHKGN